MLKILNQSIRLDEKGAMNGSATTDTCWVCDTQDICNTCDATDFCVIKDT
ncbi:freyrasin family ranthipeptide [Bacillus toyonensis]|nr:freyrasin family ranthipeptide [Bacillus toyonensis]